MINFRHKKKRIKRGVSIEETLGDLMSNSDLDVYSGEGKVTRSVSKTSLYLISFIYMSVFLLMVYRTGYLQIAKGETFREVSENNTFVRELVFAPRGKILDRNEEILSWNERDEETDSLLRRYKTPGYGSLLGYLRYPQVDSKGRYYVNNTKGEGGLEQLYNDELEERSGSLVLERNALGDVISELYIEKPHEGSDVAVSIDTRVQETLFNAIKDVAEERDFNGGAGALMDVRSGELLALVSYPDFDSNVFTNGTEEEKSKYLKSDNAVFLNRAVSGLYTPGSTVKPFFAVAALEEGIVTPEKVIVSTGSISIQSPYDKDVSYIFKDWKAHGPLDLRGAIAWSSNVYFYHIGGGFADVKGLEIDKLYYYAKLFGFERPTALGVFNEPEGLVPNKDWKESEFDDIWRIGDTYNTVIGQYNFQTTPLQLLRATGAIANGGVIIEPHLNLNSKVSNGRRVFAPELVKVVKEGMREAITEGTAKRLQGIPIGLAAKTGTAQIGNKGLINSLLIGFFPHDKPKYAFTIVMERGEQDAAIATAERFFTNLLEIAPEFKNESL